MATLGNSIFPADLGLNDLHRERISTILLGSDWGNEDSFRDEQTAKRYKRGPFLSGAERMLQSAGFDINDCFFSNAWPVMRKGGAPEEGHHPMRDDEVFTNTCRDFLKLCIEKLEPRLIITTGFAAAWFVGSLVGESWKSGREKSSRSLTSKHIDVEPVKLESGLVIVAGTHPSHLNNSKRREFNELDRNEAALLVRARRMASIADLS